jgi:hypothetical protein
MWGSRINTFSHRGENQINVNLPVNINIQLVQLQLKIYKLPFCTCIVYASLVELLLLGLQISCKKMAIMSTNAQRKWVPKIKTIWFSVNAFYLFYYQTEL